jgi:hypothetical protein
MTMQPNQSPDDYDDEPQPPMALVVGVTIAYVTAMTIALGIIVSR